MSGCGGWGCAEAIGRNVRLLNMNQRSATETFEYDIALSFAREDRVYVEQIAQSL